MILSKSCCWNNLNPGNVLVLNKIHRAAEFLRGILHLKLHLIQSMSFKTRQKTLMLTLDTMQLGLSEW